MTCILNLLMIFGGGSGWGAARSGGKIGGSLCGRGGNGPGEDGADR